MIGLGRITAGRSRRKLRDEHPGEGCETKTPPMVAIFIRVMPRPGQPFAGTAPCRVTSRSGHSRRRKPKQDQPGRQSKAFELHETGHEQQARRE